MDTVLFHWINGWSNVYSPFFDALSEASKWTSGRVVLGLVAVALIAAGPGTRKAVVLSLVAFPIANGLTDLFKDYLPMLRPCDPRSGLIVLHHGVGFLTSYGTASAHAANTAAIAFVMTYFLRKWGSIAIVLSLLTGIARIYVGVHYPSQVVLGWVCGTLVGALVILAWRAWEASRAKSVNEQNLD